jgi:hypothetical protein
MMEASCCPHPTPYPSPSAMSGLSKERQECNMYGVVAEGERDSHEG